MEKAFGVHIGVEEHADTKAPSPLDSKLRAAQTDSSQIQQSCAFEQNLGPLCLKHLFLTDQRL